MGDIHPQGNPHYWIPPANALVDRARMLAERLAALDAAGRGAPTAQTLKRFEAELERTAPAWEKAAAPLAGTKIVTYHKSWSYVSAWLGLREVGYVEPKPGIPPPSSHTAQLIGLMKKSDVKLVMVSRSIPPTWPSSSPTTDRPGW